VPVGVAPDALEEHYFPHGQKLFELGERSTLGIVMWCLTSFQGVSFRTLLANLADDLHATPVKGGVREVADRWTARFWPEYTTAYKDEIAELKEVVASLKAKRAKAKKDEPEEGEQAPEPEAVRITDLVEDYKGGFCIGGYCPQTGSRRHLKSHTA